MTVKEWTTIDIVPAVNRLPWKRSLGQACPHGREIFIVDGTFIRNTYDSDFVQGTNGWRSKFCPRGELWIDCSTPDEEVAFVALHECQEAELMRSGLDYEQAHDRAKRLENKFRRSMGGRA